MPPDDFQDRGPRPPRPEPATQERSTRGRSSPGAIPPLPPEPDGARAKSHRRTILERRLFFVSSALTALTGCPRGTEPSATGPDASATAVASAPAPSAAPTSASSAVVVAPAPSVAVPAVTVPDDVSDTAKGHFERIKRLAPEIHAELDLAEKATEGLCAIDEAACDASWEAVATHLAKARDRMQSLDSRCGGSSEDAKRFQTALEEQERVINQRIKSLEDRIQAALGSKAGRDAWRAHQEKAAIPQPCLKFRCDDW